MSVNVSQALNSPSYAHKLWLNYYYGDNSMNISSSVMGRIEAAYGEDSGYNYIAQWERNAAIDKNEYEISDDELSSFNEQGAQAAKETTGYEDSTGDAVKHQGRVVADAASGLATTVTTFAIQGGGLNTGLNLPVVGNVKLAGNSAGVSKAGEGAFNNSSVWKDESLNLDKKMEGALKDSKEAEATKQTSNDIFLAAACAINLATGIMAVAKAANEEQVNALAVLYEVMGESMAQTQDAQAEMQSMSQNLMDASDEAASVNEEANSKIDEEKSKYDLYKATYEILLAKNEAAQSGGEPLTEEEQELFKQVSEYMTTIGATIEQAQEDAASEVDGIHADMETYQEGFDGAAETIGNIDGITEYAEGFDSATKTACYVEAAAQGLNSFSGVKNGIKAGVRAAQNWAVWPLAVAWIAAAASAAAGAVMSGIAMVKQFAFAQVADAEIGSRETTQELNGQTAEMYDTEVDNFAQNVSAVEELELTLPDDIAAPESVDFAEAQPEETQDENTKKPEE